tara:strand:- start:1510 stop:1734 length:225 start_codon:yes stop_codon:yes gene_type:complete
MFLTFKKLIFLFTFNSCLFILLIIGIQNSTKKSRVDLLINETVELPISFVIGSSFISGSIIGGIITSKIDKIKY